MYDKHKDKYFNSFKNLLCVSVSHSSVHTDMRLKIQFVLKLFRIVSISICGLDFCVSLLCHLLLTPSTLITKTEHVPIAPKLSSADFLTKVHLSLTFIEKAVFLFHLHHRQQYHLHHQQYHLHRQYHHSICSTFKQESLTEFKYR